MTTYGARSPRQRSVTQIGQSQVSTGGQQFEPWQESGAKTALNQATSSLQRAPTDLSQSNYEQWGGDKPTFTGVDPKPVYSPELMNQTMNAIWGNAMAGAKNLWNQAQSLRPGMGALSPFLKELQAGIMGRAAAGGQQNMLAWSQNAAQQNAQNLLRGQQLQLGVETNRAQADLQRAQLQQQVRAQDIQHQTALQRAIATLTQPLSSQRSVAMRGYNLPMPVDQYLATRSQYS